MEISITKFTVSQQVCPRKYKLVAELSSLGCRAGELPFHRIYPDACDEGVTVVGQVDRADFTVAHIEENDGDIQYYRLTPTPESIRKCPACKDTEVILFND